MLKYDQTVTFHCIRLVLLYMKLGGYTMIKYFGFLMSLMNPFSFIHPYAFVRSPMLKSSMVAMAPLGKGSGNFVSTQATNKINSPGCTSTKHDGTKETRRTLVCTEVVIEKPSGKTIHKPSSSSKQHKADEEVVAEFFHKSAGGSSAGPSKHK